MRRLIAIVFAALAFALLYAALVDVTHAAYAVHDPSYGSAAS
jgi:hypothetical protein